MKTKIINGLLFFFLFSIIIACKPKQEEQAAEAIDIEQIKKEIQAKEDQFAEVYNSGEPKNIGYYAEDAVSFAQNTPPLKGRQAIVEFLKANMDSLSKNRRISFKTNEVFISNDENHVVEIGYFTLTDTAGKVINSGNYMTLFVKRDGKYVSLRDMSVSDMPLK
jgi:ketosteroid isomerase-like protein